MPQTTMPRKKIRRAESTTKAFDRALNRMENKRFVLKLYVTGSTPRSVQAIKNIKKICEEHLKGRYRLEIIDLYQEPWRARQDQLSVAPTLIKKLPVPLRMLVGDLSHTERVLAGLDLLAQSGAKAGARRE